MTKFNPEDFKAPEMKPLSDVTVNGKMVVWDKAKDGVVVPYGMGNIRIVDGKATYRRPKGIFGDGEESVDLDIINGNIDVKIFGKGISEEPIKDGFAVGPKEANFFRECSCKSCGAPINFYRVTDKEYSEARCKGREPNNFTEEELESLFGSVGEIDGVIYDDSRLCSQCRSYEC